MKNYYCLIIIGDVTGVEEILSKVIEGNHHYCNMGKIFIATFESNFSIWEIEEILHANKKSYFLTKMDGSNFTATIQDMKIQNDLFLDYVLKMTKINNEISNNQPQINFDPIDEAQKFTEFLDSIKNFSNRKPLKRLKKVKNIDIIPPTLDEILDKINSVGYNKLTKFEKECLEKYSKNQ
jgi:hypothetical protein